MAKRPMFKMQVSLLPGNHFELEIQPFKPDGGADVPKYVTSSSMKEIASAALSFLNGFFSHWEKHS